MNAASRPPGESHDGWDPGQYQRFAAERRQPFVDLLALCHPVVGGTVADLGCGTGELTAEAHRALGARRTVGLDASPAMLEVARSKAAVPGVSFEEGDLRAFGGHGVDLVLANASLQWVDDHRGLLAHLRRALSPGGQLAFQVPANFSHPSHVLAHQVAAEEPFADLLGGQIFDRGRQVLAPEAYAEVLYDLGATEQVVRLQVYGHVLSSSAEVVEWTRGTLLTPYRSALGEEAFEVFVARYRERLVGVLGGRRPYFYPFVRLLAWARFEAPGEAGVAR